MNWERYDNIYILVTHTHGDHSGGVGTMLQYVWFASYMKKKVTIVAPSAGVKEDLLLLLMRIPSILFIRRTSLYLGEDADFEDLSPHILTFYR